MKLAVALLLLISSLQFAFAHPPKNIEIKRAGNKIEVEVLHPVKNPAEHFIDKITVSLNGKGIIEQVFSAQQDALQYSSYFVPFTKKGDKLSVNAHCNKFGDMTREITVQ